ncbi:MAG: chemotaxis response regulator protein-glutamate methylesterase [Geobacteraceae bacterium GWC2_58_44]|nr:MAG: chemotaxis response regulator protein-glutamate methylesterase [Geobacteraceae bacterium GWC2_58_44]HBG04432.1 chemotaxis response regulator protein-glutamate methylesterase [Geobacter sp.]
MIRLLVVEDSKTVQQALVAAFSADPEIRVIGTAENGEAALDAASNLRPDIITMDINMPGMNGFEATRAIMASCPVPIVIVTGKMDPKDSATLFRVMEAGALMVLAKPEPPGSAGHADSVANLVHHIKLMSEIKVVRRAFSKAPLPAPPKPVLPDNAGQIKVVAIGASTGGPPLLQQILSNLSPQFGAAVLVVQHMAAGFTENFVHWLNQSSRLPVQLAAHGMKITPGRVYVAPDGCHMEAGAGERIVLSCAPPENGLRPSVSTLFRSVALSYGRQGAGVLLTGMGSDGASGLKSMRDRGGITIAQDRESSVVFGMPSEAIRMAAALYILPPEGIIQLLTAVVKAGSAEPAR